MKMQIKDIVNRGIVNLSNCDEEPIHIPGTIQPHGFLLAVSANDYLVRFCSANVETFLGLRPADVLQMPLAQILGGAGMAAFKNYLLKVADGVASPLPISLNEKGFYCMVHRSGNHWIAEFEPADLAPETDMTVFDQTLHFVKYMQQSLTLKQLCARVAREIRTITGYDRVMIYRFDKSYNGEVFAEAKREDLEPFLGLHYPHTDIPAQARRLYITNLLRIIPNMAYTPDPIYTLESANHASLDLSHSVLRSTSPIHVQYLQNMGVEGTLTISLIHEEKLWGLVACHHYSPKYLSQQARVNAQLQGHFLTSQIDVRQQAEGYQSAREANAALESLLNVPFEPKRESLAFIARQPQLLQLCNAGGVAILLDGKVYRQGITPSEQEMRNIAQWANSRVRQGAFATSKLAADYMGAEAICGSAAGLIFYSLNAANTASILWFNPESLTEVHWGGDPDKAIVKDANGLHPRKSFEKWKQVIRCQAREWAGTEISAATSFAYSLQKHVSLLLLTEEEARQRQLTDQLKETNEQLENINWISTHDLKEPLRKIQMQASRLLHKEKGLSDDTVMGLEKMNQFAGGMQRMIADLTSLGKVGAQPESFTTIDLNDFVKKIREELADDLAEKGASVQAAALPSVQGIPVLVRQLLVNLVGNALKFSKPDVPPVVHISSHKEQSYKSGMPTVFHAVRVADNGIGFNKAHAEDVFRIFNRLHSKAEYSGSGIGLALCKKIMQLHNGFIKADAEPGEGAAFTLYFPAA